MHRLWIHTSAHPCRHTKTHGLANRLSTHAIEVVEDIEHIWRSSGHLAPKGMVLVHGGHHQSFPNRATGERAITDIANYNPFLTIDFLIQRSTERDGTGSTYKGVVGHAAEGSEEGMHGPTQTPAETCGFGVDLG